MNTDKDNINQILDQLSYKANNLYKFIMLYNNWISNPHDYGTGLMLTMVEVHILTNIEENPGTTITQLSSIWGKTKGSMSQVVSTLCDKELVIKQKNSDNAKIINLYATDEGIKLSKAHKLLDSIDIAKTLEELLKTCTIEEVNAFYKVVEAYITLL